MVYLDKLDLMADLGHWANLERLADLDKPVVLAALAHKVNVDPPDPPAEMVPLENKELEEYVV